MEKENKIQKDLWSEIQNKQAECENAKKEVLNDNTMEMLIEGN